MKFYKIRHNPTGLFYRPCTEIYRKDIDCFCKTNLSKNGKIYSNFGQARSAIAYVLRDGYYNPDDATRENYFCAPVRKNIEQDEFSIINYEVKE